MSCSYIGYSPSFVVDTTNQTSDQVLAINPLLEYYTLKFAPVSDNFIQVFVNGVFYLPTVDYYVEGNKIYFMKPDIPVTGYIYVFFLGTNYFRLNEVSEASVAQEHLVSDLKLFEYDVFDGNGTEDTFTLHFVPGSASSLLVFVDGIVKTPFQDYTLIENVLTFTDPPALNTQIICRNMGFKASEQVFEIADLSITTDKIAEGAVTDDKLADDAVTTVKILDGSITTEKLNSEIFSDIINYEWVYNTIDLQSQYSRRLLVDTTATSINIILPSNPVVGQFVEVLDFTRNFANFNCTLVRNGKTIGGQAANYVLDRAEMHCTLIYTTGNWELFWLNAGAVFTPELSEKNCEIFSDEHTEATTFYSDPYIQVGIKTGIEYSQDGDRLTTESEEIDTELYTAYEDSKDSNYPSAFSCAVNGTEFVTGQQVIISLTFKSSSVSVSGSGVKPSIELSFSDMVTQVDAELNTTTSTTSVLYFNYTVQRDNVTQYIDITGFDTGDYTVTIEGQDFVLSTPIRVAVSFTENILLDLKNLYFIGAIELGAML